VALRILRLRNQILPKRKDLKEANQRLVSRFNDEEKLLVLESKLKRLELKYPEDFSEGSEYLSEEIEETSISEDDSYWESVPESLVEDPRTANMISGLKDRIKSVKDKLSSKRKPLSLKLQHLGFQDVRAISNQKGFPFKKRFLKGDYLVTPDRKSLHVFQRKHATFRSICDLVNHIWFLNPFKDSENLLKDLRKISLEYLGTGYRGRISAEQKFALGAISRAYRDGKKFHRNRTKALKEQSCPWFNPRVTTS